MGGGARRDDSSSDQGWRETGLAEAEREGGVGRHEEGRRRPGRAARGGPSARAARRARRSAPRPRGGRAGGAWQGARGEGAASAPPARAPRPRPNRRSAISRPRPALPRHSNPDRWRWTRRSRRQRQLGRVWGEGSGSNFCRTPRRRPFPPASAFAAWPAPHSPAPSRCARRRFGRGQAAGGAAPPRHPASTARRHFQPIPARAAR